MINIKENEKLSIMNHSCAHLLAQAVKHLYPNALFWVGPVIAEGFYYDIDLGDKTLTEEDLPAIEKEMKKLAKDGKRIVRHELTKEEALERFKNDPYKIDLISRMDENEVTISCYTQGDFTDLCRGPHVDSVKELKYFKLLKVSGAYWKGDSKNKMLQRIYGICFDNEEDLNNYLLYLEDCKNRDHRKIGKEMEKDGYEFGKGHSGNSYAQSLSLAHVFVSDPDLFQYAHGSLAALVGDEGYHDDRSDVKEFLEKRKYKDHES